MMEPYLQLSNFMDAEHPAIASELEALGRKGDDLDQTVSIYYFVRDSIRYDPFNIKLNPEHMRVSRVMKERRGHCIDKAMLFIAICRKSGIPARLGMAKVRNHMGTASFEKVLQSDVLTPHGYAEVYLRDKWVKCTPAFNKELCERLGVAPLEFDGVEDSIFQQFDRAEGGFMEYLEDYGTFSDLPVELITQLMHAEYPHLFDNEGSFREELLKR